MLNTIGPGVDIPEPVLYDRALHRVHQVSHRTLVLTVESATYGINSSIIE